ncbi:MAG: hypothetical protein H7338_14160 [Candidatus Sericytochromatia bacterium]|nr:hypothetical protein [Candidatus Sericytochromatia bacterium]
MAKNPHESDLEVVATGLGHLLPKVVFVGGAVVGFYITDDAAPPVRGTDDIDCVVEMHTLAEYHELDAELTRLGFRHDTSQGAPICRYLYQGYVVDIMPTDEASLGFTNRWYAEGITVPETVTLGSGRTIQILSIPYFCACKFEARASRGNNDFIGSRDTQDIVAILDGHTAVEVALGQVSGDLADYLKESFRTVFDVDNEELQAHLSGDFKGVRADKIRQRLTRLYGTRPSTIARTSGFS